MKLIIFILIIFLNYLSGYLVVWKVRELQKLSFFYKRFKIKTLDTKCEFFLGLWLKPLCEV